MLFPNEEVPSNTNWKPMVVAETCTNSIQSLCLDEFRLIYADNEIEFPKEMNVSCVIVAIFENTETRVASSMIKTKIIILNQWKDITASVFHRCALRIVRSFNLTLRVLTKKWNRFYCYLLTFFSLSLPSYLITLNDSIPLVHLNNKRTLCSCSLTILS